jgi:hypothetical protein
MGFNVNLEATRSASPARSANATTGPARPTTPGSVIKVARTRDESETVASGACPAARTTVTLHTPRRSYSKGQRPPPDPLTAELLNPQVANQYDALEYGV